jgi:CheY-like chemotaxis protein
MEDGLTALIVDDDSDFAAGMYEWLRLDPTWQTVSVCHDGASAMAFLTAGVAPHLILLDLEIPKVHGLDVLLHLRTDPRFQHTIVVVTGADGEPDPSRRDFLPAEVWLSKPFAMEDLSFVIRVANSRLVCRGHAGHAESMRLSSRLPMQSERHEIREANGNVHPSSVSPRPGCADASQPHDEVRQS